MLKRKREFIVNILVFFTIFFLNLFLLRKTLGLSLYGDDWLVIAVYLGKLVKTGEYLNPQTYIQNYGFEYFIGFLYKFFKDNYWIYYLISILFRSLAIFGFYVLVKKFYSFKQAIICLILLSLSAIGIDTSALAFMTLCYVGLYFIFYGLGKLLESGKNYIIGILDIFIGYLLSPIRFYVMPLLLMFIVLIKRLIIKKKRPGIYLFKSIAVSLLVWSPFTLIKIVFPKLGIRGTYLSMLSSGVERLFHYLMDGNIRVILTIFTNIGQMTYPLPLVGTGHIKNMETMILIWTLAGIILSTVILCLLYKNIKSKNKNNLLFLTVVIVFLLSFIAPWLTEPGYLYGGFHRYLILCSVSYALLVGIFFIPNNKERKLFIILKYTLLFTVIITQYFSQQRYLDNEYFNGSAVLSKKLMSEIKSKVPVISEEGTSVFYFSNFDNNIYDRFLRFGFGFHMVLLYKVPLNQNILAYSTNDYHDLIYFIKDHNIDLKNVYTFEWRENEMTDISNEIRLHLGSSIQ